MVITDFRGKYAFLSNFFSCTIHFNGVAYPAVEHAYQAAKTINPEERDMIRKAVLPGTAKRLGQMITLRNNWDEIRIRVMKGLLRKKFEHPGLRKKLLATDDAYLIEVNTWGDTFWGMVKRKGREGGMVGENMLGILLMEVRDIIRKVK